MRATMKWTCALLVAWGAAGAAAAAEPASSTPAQSSAAPKEMAHEAMADKTADMAMTLGEVKKIDKEAGKITLKHGPIQNLDMPAMTMVFRVKDQAMLDGLKIGDKVRFMAEKSNGAIVVTMVEPAP